MPKHNAGIIINMTKKNRNGLLLQEDDFASVVVCSVVLVIGPTGS